MRRMNYMLSVTTYISLPRSAGTLWPLARPPTILAAPRHQFSHHPGAPDGAASEGGHLHWPQRDSTGATLWAPQHRGPRIIPHPHRPDVSTRHLEHA
ncbi:hypothetical protein PVK06_043850 [Gossypium arboreum]|uniref:Secreted protein n=1 Tax=Gossypium arboreum TaxID=29729 RepID=A0ABR0MRB7_GOSAR|nr:hypothetical protein PVK06_043850 [Gossypium arboreum]